MNFTSIVAINLYSVIMLVLIYLQTSRQNGKILLQHRLYAAMLILTIFLLLLDICGRFDGKPGTYYVILNETGNFLMYLLGPILSSLWLLYASLQISHDGLNIKRFLPLLLLVNVVNALLLVISQYNGIYYSIDGNNVYTRGPFFWINVMLILALMIVAFCLILLNRQYIERRYLFALLFFAAPPFIAVILQALFYGIALMLNSIALSLLVVFFNIQNKSMNTDYLTGVYNRKRLEAYLKEKVAMCSDKLTFSAILIDIDQFKSINDEFGHDVGDDALEATVALLRQCVRHTDLIARFGGDEFYIVLDDMNLESLLATVDRIDCSAKQFNEANLKPYKLSFSMGYDVYDPRTKWNPEAFQKHIDNLMYADKRKKALQTGE